MCDKRNNFCYVCGLFVDKKHRFEMKTNKTVVEAFNLLFGRSYVESAWYEPEYVCLLCSTTLKIWKSGKCGKDGLGFSVPMVWHHQIWHRPRHCYFCQTKCIGYRYKYRDRIEYAEVLSVSKPVAKQIKYAHQTESINQSSKTSEENSDDERSFEPFIPNGSRSTERHLVSSEDYNDLVRDLGLSWRQSEVLASRLKQWNVMEHDFKVTFARELNLTSFQDNFKADDVDNKLVYCENVDELFVSLNHNHQPKDWRLFLDGSCKSKF